MKKRIRIYSQLALILCWSLTLLGLFDGELLAVDLASHFKLQYMLIGVLCLMAFSICKAYISLGLSVILILLNGTMSHHSILPIVVKNIRVLVRSKF